MNGLANFIDDIPNPRKTTRELEGKLKNELKCKHDIIAEWCSVCKRLDTPSIKQILLQENLEIVENILSWKPSRKNHTT